MEELQIRKNGRLIETYWYCKGKAREYRERDVTRHAPSLLFNKTSLEPNLKLRDIFLLVERHSDAFDIIIRNWCKDIVKEGLYGKKTKDSLGSDIEYLELYWYLKQSRTKPNSLSGLIFPDFHGLGKKLRKPLDESGHVWPKGTRIPYGVSFTSSADLIDTPVVLSKRLEIYGEDRESPKITIPNPEYSLGHILYGIFWELSFHGGPEQRIKRDVKSRKAMKWARKNLTANKIQ